MDVLWWVMLFALSVLAVSLLALPLVLCWRRSEPETYILDVQVQESDRDVTTEEDLLIPPENHRWTTSPMAMAGWLCYFVVLVSVLLTIFILYVYPLLPQGSGAPAIAPKPPDVPSMLTVGNISAETVVLSWESPDAGTAPITNYELQQGELLSDGTVGHYVTIMKALCTTTSATDLIANATYCFKLRACSEVGCSAFSAATCVTTRAAMPPSAPAALWPMCTTETSITVGWAASPSSGAPIHRYEVQLASDHLASFSSACIVWVPDDDKEQQHTCNVTDLRSNMVYQWRVRGINAAGAGPWSIATPIHTNRHWARPPPAAPSAPAVDHQQPCTLTFSWVPWADGGAQVLWYEAQLVTVERVPQLFTPLRVMKVMADNLLPHTRYCFSVRAVNSLGSSPWSLEVCSSTGDLTPPKPPVLNSEPLSISSDKLTVQWSPAADDDHILEYELQRTDWWTDRPFFTIFTGNTTQYTEIGPLLPTTTYAFQVRARNTAGWGPWSPNVTFTTHGAGNCGNPQDVAAYKRTKSTMKANIQSCLIRCMTQSESCATSCMGQQVGLSRDCAHCWVDEGHCTIQQCTVPCLIPSSSSCKACSQAKCFPQCVVCSGVAVDYFPP